MSHSISTGVVMATMLAIPAGSAFADTVHYNYWDAGADGSWNEPTSWSEDRVPAHLLVGDDSDYAVINSGHIVTIQTDVGTARGLYIDEGVGSTPQPAADSTLVVATGGKLIADRVIRISDGGTISVEGGDLSVIGTSYSFAVGNAGTGTSTLNVSAGSVTANNFRVGHNSNGNGVINLSGGQIDGVFYLGGDSAGEVNQIAGTWTGSSSYLGYGSTGVYNLSGGEFSNRGRVRIGHSSQGTFNMTGGQFNATAYPVLLGSDSGSGDGLWAVSGGAVTMNSGMYIGNANGTGSGTLRITGNDASFTITDTGREQAGLDLYANGTLNFQIGNDGITTIMIDTSSPTNASRASLLAGTLDIDLLGGFVPTVGQTFDLISNQSTYTGTTGGSFTDGYDITGLTLAAEDQPYWSFAVVNEGDRNILRLTNTGVIPEPASLALLAVGGVAMLGRRRM